MGMTYNIGMNRRMAKKLSKKLRFSYFTSRYWLEFLCEHKRKNREHLVYVKALDGDNDVLQYTPSRACNLVGAISLATEEEIKDIESRGIDIIEKKEAMREYFFKTKDIIEMKGNNHKRNRYAANYFENNYDYRVKYSLDKETIIHFLKDWDRKQKLKTLPYQRGLDFCYYILDQLGNDNNLRAVFVLVEDRLVGFSIGERINSKQWIALHQKVDYNYKGLGRWLFRERARLFEKTEEFAAGGAMANPGIAEFKESLYPYRVEPYYSLKLKGESVL